MVTKNLDAAIPNKALVDDGSMNILGYHSVEDNLIRFKKSGDCHEPVGVIGEEVNYKNFTIQSIQIGLPLTSSMNTLAGCISSNAIRSEI